MSGKTDQIKAGYRKLFIRITRSQQLKYQVRMNDSTGQVRQIVEGMIAKVMNTKRGQL